VAVEGATGKIAVTGALICLAVAGIAAAASPGRLHVGDPAWWLLTGLALAALAVLVVAAAVLLLRHPKAPRVPRAARERPQVPSSILLIVVVVAALIWALSELPGGGPAPDSPATRPGPLQTLKPKLAPTHGGGNVGPWLAIGLAAVILAGMVVVAVHRLRTRPAVAPVELVPGDPLAAAVEAALADLEGETDPRRAVIKAYARAEAVLRENGLPRRPSEAPLEYLDRVLRDLGARAGAVDRLTELFERAAFSQHAVGPEMRDEAVAVFLGLRDKLSAEAVDP
jgi:hypothetical protein